jgi:hypothetical protein
MVEETAPQESVKKRHRLILQVVTRCRHHTRCTKNEIQAFRRQNAYVALVLGILATVIFSLLEPTPIAGMKTAFKNVEMAMKKT